MTLGAVPWLIDGATHPVEAGRSLAYVLGGASDGVAGHGDLRVTASAVPDGNVNVASGGANLLNRFAGGVAQGYVVRNDGTVTVAIDAQGAGSDRYDLVCLIVEDTQYPGQPDPASVANGPYAFIRVFENVGGAVSLPEVAANQTGYALAKILIPASTSVITQSNITDLRHLLQPRSKSDGFTHTTDDTVTVGSAPADFPLDADRSVVIPPWANRVRLTAHWPSVTIAAGGSEGGAGGAARVLLGALATPESYWSRTVVPANSRETFGVVVSHVIEVPVNIRGTVQSLTPQMWTGYVNNAAVVSIDNNNPVLIQADFFEVAGVD